MPTYRKKQIAKRIRFWGIVIGFIIYLFADTLKWEIIAYAVFIISFGISIFVKSYGEGEDYDMPD